MATRSEFPTLTIQGSWEEIFQVPGRAALERILPDYLRPRRWFGGKTRTIRSVTLQEVIPIPCSTSPVYYNLIKVEFADGPPDLYALPLSFASGTHAQELLDKLPHAIVTRLEGGAPGVLFDALAEASFGAVLLEAIGGKQTFATGQGEIRATGLSHDETIRGPAPLSPRIGRAEQSNTSIIFGDQLILKCFRRLEEGVNLDLEIGSYLTQVGFSHIAPVVGAIEFRRDLSIEPVTLAILHRYVANQGDAWHHTLKELGTYYEAILAGAAPELDLPSGHLLDLAETEPPARDDLGSTVTSAILLGQRTAELHLALAKGREPSFAPEPFTAPNQESFSQSLRDLHGQVFDLLRARLADLPAAVQEEARQVLDRSRALPGRLARIQEGPLTGQRIRCHGDYHLGQVLFTGRDFVIIDFEGEPARPLAERRLKTSPLRDVAGMIRSFHYAVHSGLPENSSAALEPWAHFWYSWASAAFLRAYRTTAAGASFLPASRPELELLLDTYLLEKAMYELAYELNHRPDWVRIPLRGIGQLLGEPGEISSGR